MLSSYGADVLRVVRPGNQDPSPIPWHGIRQSICLDLKNPSAMALMKDLLKCTDVLIEPYRPGVLETLGLVPEEVLRLINPRLIIARLTGFRRDGKYSNLAGHDINYLAVSGILSQLGRADGLPYPPANILADFAAGGLMCAFAILAALFDRSKTGRGQIVESNMVDGTSFLGTFMRKTRKTPLWDQPRGENFLDGGCPWYDVYECQDGKYMAVGALEPQFFQHLINGLRLHHTWPERRHDRQCWPELRELIRTSFLEKSRAQWEAIFDKLDACVTPVLSQTEIEASGYEQRRPFALSASCTNTSPEHDQPKDKGPAEDSSGEQVLCKWMGWEKGRHYDVTEGSLVKCSIAKL